MVHGNLAQAAAVIGATASVGVLLAQHRRLLLVLGLAVLTLAEALLAAAVVPSHDVSRLTSPAPAGAAVVGLIGIVVLTVVFVRYPAVVAPALLLVAPFRIPVDVGSLHAFLLLPLYAVLAAAVLALTWIAVFRPPQPWLPPVLVVPAAAFIAFDAISLLWSVDVRAGAVELLFFIFPFAALVAVIGRARFASWLPKVLAVEVIGLASAFAAIGLWQERTHRVFFARDVAYVDAYSNFYRVTSVFKDPSIYARHLVLALVILVLLLWLGKIRIALAAALMAILAAGLLVSYSQSAMFTLFFVALGVTLVTADRRSKAIVLSACVVGALVAAASFVVIAQGHSARKFTSGRSRLASVTAKVIAEHPYAGVGVGGQPLASRDEVGRGTVARNASHATPLTVVAELGIGGAILYVIFLAGAALLLLAAVQQSRALGLGLSAVFLAILIHSLFYSGFFEDPIMWGTLAVAGSLLAVRVEALDTLESGARAPWRYPVFRRWHPAPVRASTRRGEIRAG
jgi:hypothetical protein